MNKYREEVRCSNCETMFTALKKDNRKFCSKSCAATFNNNKRDRSVIEKQRLSILATLEKKGVIKDRFQTEPTRNPRKIKPKLEKKRQCKVCEELKELQPRKRVCEDCRYGDYSEYRNQAHFKFSIKDYSFCFSEVELDLLKELGMYAPPNRGNNLSGVSRDHRYSVKQGFIDSIPLHIIKHPANCELMLQTDNSSKYSDCSISLKELIERIKKSENIKKFLTDEQLEEAIKLIK